jgi:hypothetical protein
MPFLLLLLPLLAKIPGMIGDFFTQKAQMVQAQMQMELAVEQAKLQLAGQMAADEMEVAKTVLGSTSPHFKYFTFFMWFGPYMLQIVWPAAGQVVFQNMAQMPVWYAQSCVAIMFTVWGISVAGPVVNQIFNNLGGFFQSSRTDKIAMKAVDKQAFFDALRHLNGNVTPADVAKYDPILDEVNDKIDTKV